MFKRITIASLVAIVSITSGSARPIHWSAYLLPSSEITKLRTLSETNPAAFAGAMLYLYGPRQ